ncbi:DUF3307 domain-containing protein [Aegicerativicinus sediminis]|uniref:DUF3307 domain-containing protein n=1 Tax=Aegicerativicinus sediminis TaxID=2893202 RepID=UPI001E35471A|nr:DUF3307 domain-containing protein [Aegicerativicinus sediminis]
MILLIKLLLAHVIGDFLLQPLHWVIEKQQKKLKSPKLYLHVLIHIVLLFLILWDIKLWKWILFIAFTHFLFDGLKANLQNDSNKRVLFFIDQAAHLLIILLAYYFISENTFQISELLNENNLTLLLAVLFLTKPTSLILQTIFSKWKIDELTDENDSLRDAGKYIGILERLLVFTFIVFRHWEAVGFLITAKSVYRFGDLKEAKHRKLTEYILIGTLLSFGIAILVSLGYLFALSHL